MRKKSMAGELFKSMAGVQIVHIPHKGSGEARTSVMPHALQVRWILKHADDPREVDNRVYVFAPERGAVSVR